MLISHISTVNTAVLPSLSDTVHSPLPQFIQNQAPIHHPNHLLYACCHHQWKDYPMLHKNISLFSHCIFADLNAKTTQQEVTESSPFIGRKFIFKPVSVWLCFPRQQKQSLQNEGLIPQAASSHLLGTRASFHGMECVNTFPTKEFVLHRNFHENTVFQRG